MNLHLSQTLVLARILGLMEVISVVVCTRPLVQARGELVSVRMFVHW
jgi:hypothetical protein